MKYAEALQLLDNNNDIEVLNLLKTMNILETHDNMDIMYFLRLIKTFDCVRWWCSDDGLSKRETEKIVKSAIVFLEFVGIQNLISDWDEIKGQK